MACEPRRIRTLCTQQSPVRKFEMTTLDRQQKFCWSRAAACSALLITAACSPAGTSAPAPAQAPAPTPAAPPLAASPMETAASVAAPVRPAPTVSTAAATTRVIIRPSAPPPALSATLPASTTPITPATITPVRSVLPAGPGRDTVQQVCSSCHAIGMVTATGRTSDDWAEMIERMIGLGLEASDEDLQIVHAYLSREFPPRRAN